MKKLYVNDGSPALASDRIGKEGALSPRKGSQVALVLAQLLVTLVLVALTTRAYAQDGQAKVSDVDIRDLGTFSGTYQQAKGPLVDHP